MEAAKRAYGSGFFKGAKRPEVYAMQYGDLGPQPDGSLAYRGMIPE